MIEALPAIVERHPEVIYLIAGRTHPDVAHREGERYRLSLERAVLDLGLEDHVEFDDRFLSIDEIADLLAATDVFVTPYRQQEQISSGALTFGLAAGCGVVSTPYWYAQDMLSLGRRHARAVRRSRPRLPTPCAATSKSRRRLPLRAPKHGGSASSSPGRPSRRRPRRSSARRSSSRRASADRSLPRPAARRRCAPITCSRSWTTSASSSTRTASFRTGRAGTASTTWRASQSSRSSWPVAATSRSGRRSSTGRSRSCRTRPTPSDGLRNFMSYDRRWLDEPHHGDHVGRSIWALGEILATAWVPAVVGPSERLLDTIVRTIPAEGVACGQAPTPPSGWRTSTRTGSTWWRAASSSGCWSSWQPPTPSTRPPGWLWFEDGLTYDNARLPHALIVGGVALGRDELTQTGLDALRWLGDESGLADGTLRLTGHGGRDRAEPAPGEGDEQPLDASAFVEAELAAFAVTGDPEHGLRAQHSFDWFLGRNKLRRPLYDFATGGCCDGLGDETTNDNEGAESTLAFHRAALLLDTAGLPAVLRHGAARSRSPRERRASCSRAIPANPILSAGDWPYPVNVVFNPAAAQVGDTTVVLARVEDLRGHLAPHRRTLGERRRRLDRSTRSRCSRQRTGSRASSGASRIRASSSSRSSSAG